MTTRVDLMAGSPGPGEAARIAVAAEALGFDALWVAETRHDPFLTLALMATATSRLELGTSVAIALARSPVAAAYTPWDLATIAPGRFHLGLGTQVRGHIERRFGMPWSAPAPRLEEWIGALRAAWASWGSGVPFRFRSEHFDLSLMPEFFRPPPAPDPGPIPISVAGVGPGLARLAGRIADGFQVHPFHTARYLDEVLEPALRAGEAERADERPRRRADRIVPVYLVPAGDAAIREEARRQISFYAATPSYRAVLALHGRERVGERLSRLAVAGRWEEMPPLVDDDFLAEVAVVAPREALVQRLAERCAGRADRVMPLLPFEVDADGARSNAALWEQLIAGVRRSA